MEEQVNETVAVAKKKKETEKGPIRTLSTGVRIKLHPVPMGLWQDALKQLRSKEPKVPTFSNPDKGGRVEENPSDPDYIRDRLEYAELQQEVSSDLLLMFGAELVDGVPEDDGWLKKLLVAQRLGIIDLSPYDLEDPIDLEFVYKKFVAAGPKDAAILGESFGPSEEEVEEATEFFPGDEERSTDPELPAT